MKVYCTAEGASVHVQRRWFRAIDFSLNGLFRAADPMDWLRSRLSGGVSGELPRQLDPPLESQEVWAAGVTYRRSREARMEESGRQADIYERVYDAERPELFFKSTRHRVVGHGGEVRIRADSQWNVPEAELALAVNREGRVFGYTIGNDMSSRSLEGDNPLYLSQAKVYDGSCALGPCLMLADGALPQTAEIALRVVRQGREVYRGSTRISEMKRTAEDLVEYLFRDNSFPDGCYLLTGTGIVPEAGFTLAPGDEVSITIDPIGTLANRVTVRTPGPVGPGNLTRATRQPLR